MSVKLYRLYGSQIAYTAVEFWTMVIISDDVQKLSRKTSVWDYCFHRNNINSIYYDTTVIGAHLFYIHNVGLMRTDGYIQFSTRKSKL